jgi:uncharacterized protein YceK
MRRSHLRRALAALLLPVLAGCGTLANTFEDEPKNKIYVGARVDLDAFGHGGFLDLPFSLVLDTIFLPYTIPKTIANYAADEVKEDSRQPSAFSLQQEVDG